MANIAIPHFDGTVIVSEDARYDDARRIWNGMHDRHPAIIAIPNHPQDVATLVTYARDLGLDIAIRGGGHSIPGFGVVDGGLVIDLSAISHVDVDPENRIATVGGGALLGDVDRATQPHGLVVPAGVVSHTGAGGLTLGGGIGRLMRRFGLTIDSLLSAEVVLADGSVVRASAEENSDLFWALRGGGGNFGVVTEFTYRLHELSEVLVLSTFHTIGQARRMLEVAQQTMTDETTSYLHWTCFVRRGRDEEWLSPEYEGVPGIATLIEWSGPVDEGRVVLDAIRESIDPAGWELRIHPFTEIQSSEDELLHHGVHAYSKAAFARELSDELVDVVLTTAEGLGSSLSQFELLSAGGAIKDVPSSDSAISWREAGWVMNALAIWEDPDVSEAEVAWARSSYELIVPFAMGGGYVNFADADEEGAEWVAQGDTLERLRGIKSIYDPENVFHVNQNIVPQAASERTAGVTR